VNGNEVNLVNTEQIIGVSLQTTILGMGAVFLVLALLIAIINGINKMLRGFNKPEYEKEPSEPEPLNIVENADGEDPEELIAVISAAVAASLNRSTHDIVVRSIRRIPEHTPIWNRVGRQEQIASRL